MITCFNRDQFGNCLAYTSGMCTKECQARIPTVERKISLLNCLIARAQSKKDIRRLKDELMEAQRVKAIKDEGRYESWMGCYYEDVHRGEKGGASESDSNRATSLKQLMKDNRAIETKLNKEQQAEYKEQLAQWEEEHGKLERLGKTSMTHSKVDSYTNLPICFCDNGAGTCNGQRSAKSNLSKDCKECSYLKEGV